MTTCTKIFADIPFAHRQHNHDGHCKFIHGHNWTFEFTFGCNRMDSRGFVIDFGDLKWLKVWLNEMFDHKLVLCHADPLRPYLQGALLDVSHTAEITAVPDASCEGLARYVFEIVNGAVHERHDEEDKIDGRRVWLQSITVREDSKNSATYQP